MSAERAVLVIGTLDTKGPEIAFLRDELRAHEVTPIVVDVGSFEPPWRPDIDRSAVAFLADKQQATSEGCETRAVAIEVMMDGIRRLTRELFSSGRICGMIGIGGSSGAAIASAAAEVLPVGVPKVIVSTVAAGDTRPYVGTRDIHMIHSVVDLIGLNRVTREVLRNAAASLCGMVKGGAKPVPCGPPPIIGITCFGEIGRAHV